MAASHVQLASRVRLAETLDRVLNKGVVVVGDLTLSVADIDLIYLRLQLLLTSVETARRHSFTPLSFRGQSADGPSLSLRDR